MYTKKHNNSKLPFKRKHFEGDIIIWLVRWYCRYALSYYDLKEIASERGLSISRSTICRWVHEFAPLIKKLIKPHLKRTSGSWRLDESVLQQAA